MAGGTAEGLAVASGAAHSFVELAVVRVFVTSGAGEIFEVILRSVFEFRGHAGFVARSARCGEVGVR